MSAALATQGKLDIWQSKRQKITELVIKDSEHKSEVEQIRDWVLRQMEDDARYFNQRQSELDRIATASKKEDPYDLSRRVLDLIGRAGIHPHSLQTKLRKLFETLKDLADAATKYRLGRAGSGESAA